MSAEDDCPAVEVPGGDRAVPGEGEPEAHAAERPVLVEAEERAAEQCDDRLDDDEPRGA